MKKIVSAMLAAFLMMQTLLTSVVASVPYDAEVVQKNAFAGEPAVYPAVLIDDFNDGENSWQAGANVDRLDEVTSIANKPGGPFEGKRCLEITPRDVKCYEWRTALRTFSEPLDLSEYRYLALAANIYGWRENDFYLRMTVFSGTQTYAMTAQFSADRWQSVFFDLSGCSFANKIDRLEISYMKNDDLSNANAGEPGYNAWTGRLQLDCLCATNAEDWSFDRSTEGFAGSDGVAIGQKDGCLTIDASAENGYIQSPAVQIETDDCNTVCIEGQNLDTAALTLSWSADGESFVKGNSMTLSAARLEPQRAVFAITNPGWTGTVKTLRLAFAGIPNGQVSIDRIYLEQRDNTFYAGAVTSVTADRGDITVCGEIDDPSAYSGSAVAALYALELYQQEKTADLSELTPVATAPLASEFAMTVSAADDSGRSRLDKKFVVAVCDGEDRVLADCGKFVTNPEALAENKEAYPKTTSIKGLQVLLPSDAERLGVQHAGVNIAFDTMLTKTDHGDASIPYTYEGETYYFIKSQIEKFDNDIKSMTDNDILVNAILILYRNRMNDPDSPNVDLIHPDSTTDGTVYAVNLTNEAGVKYYKAIMSFMAERYSRPDKKYGRLNGYIVGNEVGQNRIWNNMGDKLIDDYVEQYERQVRLTNLMVKQAWSEARVYISLDNFWNSGNGEKSTSVYDNKKIVDKLNDLTKARGDFKWCIAFHPYPQNLYEPRTWNDNMATDSFDTHQITFKNLQVLVNYLKQDALKCSGQARRIILSEQGFTSINNSAANQKIQAAAYAYAYYKAASFPEIDAFIFYRHVDHMQEGGLLLGIWTCQSGQICEPGKEKTVYDVFKKIDTVESFETTEFALDVIAKDIPGVKEWTDLIPEFNPKQINANLPAQMTGKANVADESAGVKLLDDMQGDLSSWKATDNIAEIRTAEKAGGGNMLAGRAFAQYRKDFCGVTYTPDSPLDLTQTPYLLADVSATGMGKYNDAEYMIRAYSGEKVLEASVVAPKTNEDTLYFDLSGWDGISSVDKIKVWARPNAAYAWRDGGEIQISRLAAAETAKYIEKTPEEKPDEKPVEKPEEKPDEKPAPQPAFKDGTAVVNGKTVLYKDGKQVTGSQTVVVAGKTYLVKSGAVQKAVKGYKVVTLGKKSYIVDAKGYVQLAKKGKLVKVSKSKWYVVDKKGVVVKAKKGNAVASAGKYKYVVSKKGLVQKAKKKYALLKAGKNKYIVNKKGVVQIKKKKIRIKKTVYKTDKKGVAKKDNSMG